MHNGVVTVRRCAALGDVLAASSVAKKLMALGRSVNFEAHIGCHCILRYVPGMGSIQVPGVQAPDVNLDGAYENHPHRTSRTFSSIFIEAANNQLAKHNIVIPDHWNAAPVMEVSPEIKAEYLATLNTHSKPWVMVNPKSASWANRTIPNETWSQVAAQIMGTCFWIGTEKAPPGFVDLNVRHVDTLIRYMACASLVITPDTGPLHIAAALGIPVVSIEQASSPQLHVSDQRDFITVATAHLDCLNCQKNMCPIDQHNPPCQKIDPVLIANAANARLGAVLGDSVSAVICVYNTDVHRLNRCLTHTLNQVDEIVIAIDGDGVIPKGIFQHPKIIYAPNWTGNRMGYGKTANRGARHSNGKWILLLNDDVFLAPDAVQKFREAANPDTGIVAGLLFYPNGTIQHGGTYRNPGDTGFGHLDLGARESRIKDVVDMENVTLAAALIRRKAFYAAMGFDEEYDVYCEDNDLCMKIRRAGWGIRYTPFGTGIHEEHQTTKKDPIMLRYTMRQSCQTFARKWGWYFQKNAHTIPGTFV